MQSDHGMICSMALAPLISRILVSMTLANGNMVGNIMRPPNEKFIFGGPCFCLAMVLLLALMCVPTLVPTRAVLSPPPLCPTT